MRTSSRSLPVPALLRPLAARTLVPGPADSGARGRPWRLLLLGCLVLAALSLAGPHEPTYDPWAWLIWGREIVHLDLSTSTGPSWKPLPVLFTTPFALLGDTAAPLLWLVVARAGGLLAIAFAFRLAARIAGPVAGVLAAVALILANPFIFHFSRGNSEGLLVAVCLWALERHLDGRRRDALLLGVAGALLRPEVWPFVALYGLWLMLGEWRGPRRWRTVAVVLGSGAAIGLLWLLPEYFGSGDFFRAAARALEPVPNSPAQAQHPFLAVFTHSASALPVPAYVGGVLAVALALRGGRRERRHAITLAIAAVSTVLMLAVAAGAVIGFTGNLRYVLLPASLVCVLAGVGWVELFAAVGGRWDARAAAAVAVVALVASAPFLIGATRQLQGQLGDVRAEARKYAAVPDAIARAGGEAAVTRCGRVYTRPLATQSVAWHLHLHEEQVGIFPFPPGTVIAEPWSPLARDPRFHTVLAETGRWTVRTSCGAGAGR